MPFLGKQPLSGEFKKLDTIVPDGSASYTLQYDGSDFQPGQAERLIVSVNGVIQAPGTAFNVSGSTITFSESVTSNDVIDFIISMGEVGNAVVPADNSVTTGMLVDGAVTADKTDFNVATSHMQIPSGTTAQRPSSPANGMIRYNTDENYMEEYRAGQWLILSNVFSATGGTEVTAGGYKYHTFTSSGTFTVESGSANIDALIIAGGGGGGADGQYGGGGGGAGGLILLENHTASTQQYSIVIGAGGSGADGVGNTGSNTTGFGQTANGGGGGGNTSSTNGLSGGSGGGGCYVEGFGGQGTSGQGYQGGTHTGGSGNGMGGGGAGEVGEGTSVAGGVGGAGGDGLQYSTWATATSTGDGGYYAGGGGGGEKSTPGGIGLGGAGGGGDGGHSSNSPETPRNGVSGDANTGGGGGGNGAGNYDGGNGGSGIVIIRYPI